MQTLNNVKVDKLVALASNNNTAKAMFKEWSERQRIHGFVNIGHQRRELIKHGNKVNDKEYNEAIKAVVREGFGSVRAGKLHLNTSMRLLGSAALTGKPNDIVVNKEKRAARTQKQLPKVVEETTKVIYVLRDKAITFSIPNDITSSEMNKLVSFLKTLGTK